MAEHRPERRSNVGIRSAAFLRSGKCFVKPSPPGDPIDRNLDTSECHGLVCSHPRRRPNVFVVVASNTFIGLMHYHFRGNCEAFLDEATILRKLLYDGGFCTPESSEWCNLETHRGRQHLLHLFVLFRWHDVQDLPHSPVEDLTEAPMDDAIDELQPTTAQLPTSFHFVLLLSSYLVRQSGRRTWSTTLFKRVTYIPHATRGSSAAFSHDKPFLPLPLLPSPRSLQYRHILYSKHDAHSPILHCLKPSPLVLHPVPRHIQERCEREHTSTPHSPVHAHPHALTAPCGLPYVGRPRTPQPSPRMSPCRGLSATNQ